MEPVWAPVVGGPHHADGLARGQRGEFGFVAGQQDPLEFLFAEAISNVAMAALAPVRTIAGTSELPFFEKASPTQKPAA